MFKCFINENNPVTSGGILDYLDTRTISRCLLLSSGSLLLNR